MLTDEYKYRTIPNSYENDLYLKIIDALEGYIEKDIDTAKLILSYNDYRNSGGIFLNILSLIIGMDRPIINGKVANDEQFINYLSKEIDILKTGDSISELLRIISEKDVMNQFGYDDYIVVIYNKREVLGLATKFKNNIPKYKYNNIWIYLYSSKGFLKSTKDFICYLYDRLGGTIGDIGVQFLHYRILAPISEEDRINKNPVRYAKFPVPLGHTLIMNANECESNDPHPHDDLALHLKHQSYIFVQEKDANDKYVNYYLTIKQNNIYYYLIVNNDYYKLNEVALTVLDNTDFKKHYLTVEANGINYYIVISKRKTENVQIDLNRFLIESGFTMDTFREETKKLHDIINRLDD